MKKIMFNDRYGLTRAVIDGRKTMTRRVVSDNLQDEWDDYDDFCTSVNAGNFPTTREYRNEKEFFLANARYKLGDVVAVAQSYQDAGFACDRFMFVYVTQRRARVWRCDEFAGWNNKMFVCADRMPHQIRITDVRCERLQDISDSECLREGVQYIEELGVYYFERPDREGFYFDTPRAAFASLIDKVSGKGTWENNPWIIVYEFELVK